MSESNEMSEEERQAEYVRQVQAQIMGIVNKVKEEDGLDIPIDIQVVNHSNEDENNE